VTLFVLPCRCFIFFNAHKYFKSLLFYYQSYVYPTGLGSIGILSNGSKAFLIDERSNNGFNMQTGNGYCPDIFDFAKRYVGIFNYPLRNRFECDILSHKDAIYIASSYNIITASNFN
jgi:hypothetical protein